MSKLDRLLGPDDLSARLRVPLATVYRWNSSGEGPPRMRVGRHVRYDLDEVDEWLTSRRVGAEK